MSTPKQHERRDRQARRARPRAYVTVAVCHGQPADIPGKPLAAVTFTTTRPPDSLRGLRLSPAQAARMVGAAE